MSFMEELENNLNITTTQNGDKAYLSTLSKNLDFFASAGVLRGNVDKSLDLFIRAFNEDKNTALKILFYSRDIREGLGERDIFKKSLRYIGRKYPSIAKQLVSYISDYGRFDDLLCLIGTEAEAEVVTYIKKQLEEDIENKKQNKEISLLAKWLPSINASCKDTRRQAISLAYKLGYQKEDYRKMLSFLRKDLIIENNLREKDYTFDYDSVPSRAFNQYINAFSRNDKDRFDKFIGDAQKGKKNINVSNISPYEIVKKIRRSNDEDTNVLNTMFDNYSLNMDNKKTLVVRDGSGSMYCGWNTFITPIDVADAFTILYSSKLSGEFKNSFISFSESPKFIKLNGRSLSEKLRELESYNEVANTNISKVYNQILNVYKSKNFTKEDAIDRILIISDMEFDCVGGYKESTFEKFKREFKNVGYKMPEVVFLSVATITNSYPVKKDEKGTVLISGTNKNVIDLICTNESIDPIDFVYKVIRKYNFIDTLVLA